MTKALPYVSWRRRGLELLKRARQELAPKPVTPATSLEQVMYDAGIAKALEHVEYLMDNHDKIGLPDG